MGASPPKQIPPTPPPPPVRQTGEDIAFTKDEERRKQAGRQGYAATLQPARSLLSGQAATTEPKRSLLG